MKDELAGLKERIEAAQGKIPFDLLIRNVRLVNVYTRRIVPANIGVKGGRVVSIASDPPPLSPVEEFDGGGMYAIPGLIDAHCHIESTLLTPAALAESILPQGTTTLLIDPMEIANVAGLDGLLAFMDGMDSLPYRAFIEVSSRVPTAPGLETTGGVLGLSETEQLLDHPRAVSLGELDPSKIEELSAAHLAKIIAAQARGKIANGHAIGLSGNRLDAYAAAGLSDDHECVTYDDLAARLSRGMKVMIREGSSERNLETLVSGVIAHGDDTRNLMFCTDDKHPSDIRREGHINYNVNRAIELGLDPIAAIRIATLNTAEHFRIDHLIGAIAPGRYADLILSPSLNRIRPRYVFVGGRLVAAAGALTGPVSRIDYPDDLRHTVHLLREPSVDDFRIPAAGRRARVIELIPDQIVNRAGEAEVAAEDGFLIPDRERDILPIVCVERYGKNGNIGRGLIRGFGLTRGAIAGSVAHDHHNIMVVGTDPEDMRVAVTALAESQGGFVVAAEGEVQALLPLPLCGLMSEAGTEQVEKLLTEVREAARALGCPLAAPFMTLSFVSLPTVPALGITDHGLIDVEKHRVVPLFLS